jgi:hypothetical protein
MFSSNHVLDKPSTFKLIYSLINFLLKIWILIDNVKKLKKIKKTHALVKLKIHRLYLLSYIYI